MRLLVIDGNSILNRAFYGIKLLTTKDGRYTNGIYGFMNIFHRLLDDCKPDRVAVAFDVKAPTFRHEMYTEYKAGRKAMPDELREQMPVLKELLTLLGYKIVEKAGWEADDILGTLSVQMKDGDKCFIATGDRDSLQLVSDCTTVLLASTKMGRTQTVAYDTAKIAEEYGVTPKQMIEIKALQGDSSDNIPGIAGVGPKTAGELIQKYTDIDYIFENLDALEIKPKLREKLEAGKDSAFLSRKLGTISLEAPIDTDMDTYIPSGGDEGAAARLLASLEMFKMIETFNLSSSHTVSEEVGEAEKVEVKYVDELSEIKLGEKLFFIPVYDDGEVVKIAFFTDNVVYVCENNSFMFASQLAEILADETKEKVTYDVKPLYSWAFARGVEISGKVSDIMIAGYILNPSASDYHPSRMIQEYGGILPEISEEDSLALDTASLAGAWEKAYKELEENGQLELMYSIEMPLAKVLSSMEITGFLVDSQSIEEYGAVLETQINSLVERIYDLAGEEFNINSPKQLGTMLFEKLGLPSKKKTKSGYSTNADVLEALAPDYPIVALVLEYRTLAKLKSTYCDGLKKCVAPDGRIHSTLNQTETRTGRISSTEPNLQNIPVRSEIGRELRKFFVAKEGCVLVDADYSQIELRVLAHIADDERMLSAFNEGDDIHTITASQVFNMPTQAVTPLMRTRAKAVNFGIVYGIGAFSLAKDIGVTRAEADKYIKGYLHKFAGVDAYMQKVIAQAKNDGYVSTLFGRRRYLPELTASNAMLRQFGERVARNMPIQGTAADIIKIAMIRVYERIKAENLKARLIMQVHDELIVEAPENEVGIVCSIVKEEMENAATMNVKLTADVHSGKSWYEAKD
ncbi:MAG: DNA polymerase I [Acutalibacteraceae bacterium]|nr:DNA polymerase I [Acutalibacteraceae bacterium]